MTGMIGFGKRTLLYGVGQRIDRLLSVITLPIFTAILSPKDFGIIAMLVVMGLIARPIFELGLNVSTGEGHTITEVFNLVADYLGVQLPEPVPVVPPGPDDVPAVVLDPSLTEGAFDWKAQVPFTESVRRTLHWYDKYGVGAIFSHLASPSSKS